MPHYELELRRLILDVRLGWTEAERSSLQPVAFSVFLRFHAAPEGMTTDELKDTVCYGEIATAIDVVVSNQSFKLIEHLGHKVFTRLKEQYGKSAALNLEVHKLHPPVERLEGGSVFRIRER